VQTEVAFILPRGYLDAEGVAHREGAMRLATALDEIAPLGDPRVRENEAYLAVLLLTRVVTRLGSLPAITPQVIEGLFSADMAYLEDLYRRINEVEAARVSVICPACQHRFEVDLAPGDG
jgi:hypothetical protein